MLEIIFLFILAFFWIIFATAQDLKTKEIPNWLNFSLVIFALAFRFFYSLFSLGNFTFFYQGLLGFVIFFFLGNIFYYGKLFAGGDAKLFISLGAILPVYPSFISNLNVFFLFILIFLISGAVYGILVSITLCAKNFKKFKKNFKEQLKKNKNIIYLLLTLGIFFLILSFFNNLFLILSAASFIFSYFYPYAKAVDEAAMIKFVNPKELREGDWLYSDIKVGNKVIKAEWGGITKQEILLLRKKNKNVKIRNGVVFTPVFLVSFLIFFYLWISGLWYSFW